MWKLKDKMPPIGKNIIVWTKDGDFALFVFGFEHQKALKSKTCEPVALISTYTDEPDHDNEYDIRSFDSGWWTFPSELHHYMCSDKDFLEAKRKK